jgi:hypothetical protein
MKQIWFVDCFVMDATLALVCSKNRHRYFTTRNPIWRIMPINKLVQAIRRQDWHTANENFAQAMQSRLADRLAIEKRIVANKALNEAAHALGTLVRCKKCNAWVDLAFGADEPAAHQDAAGTKDDPRSPGDHDDICDACDYGGEGNWFPGTVGTHFAGKRLKEDTVSAFEVQRVFDEIGDVGETELLCGVSGLRVNENGSVISFVTEGVAVRMYDFEHPDAEGKFRDIVAKCPKCNTVFPYQALSGLAHMGSDDCPDCGVPVKAGARYGTFQWDDVNDPHVATYLGD